MNHAIMQPLSSRRILERALGIHDALHTRVKIFDS
jgi:hypothetical protein